MPTNKPDKPENALVPQARNEKRRPGLRAALAFKTETERDGEKLKRAVTFAIDPEDVIVFFAGLIALSFSISMIVGWIPINGWTIGVIGLSGLSPGIAKIVKARNAKKSSKRTQ